MPMWGMASAQLGSASTVVVPEQPAALEYAAPYSGWMQGEVGAPGTTKHRGLALQIVALGLLGGMLLLVVVLLVVAIVAAVAA